MTFSSMIYYCAEFQLNRTMGSGLNQRFIFAKPQKYTKPNKDPAKID
jgi:hypothetical protein